MYHSQLGQDKWVHSILGDRSNGFFVELGAADGLYLSNTLFFERELDWNGVCIEPNDNFLDDLKKNRRCHISNGLAAAEEGHEVQFGISGATSGIIDGKNTGPFTNTTTTVQKVTTTLGQILDSFQAPAVIDYLSLDVEGQEYNILSTFPYDKYKFRCITVEHNAPHVGPEQQQNIRTLLESNGYTYVRGNEDIHKWGHGPIDDFYVHPDLV